jgi:hypothetical protein
MEAQTYGKRYNEINKDVLLDITAKNRGENVLISPLSTILILTMAGPFVKSLSVQQALRYTLVSALFSVAFVMFIQF